MSKRSLKKRISECATWLINDLTLDQQKELYKLHAEAYKAGGHKVYPFSTWQAYAIGGRTPWQFIGDTERTGYVTIKKIPELPIEIYKLTSIAGSKRAKLLSIVALKDDVRAVFGAVTEDIYQMAIKLGFDSVDIEDVKYLVEQFSNMFGDIRGNPELNELGEIVLNHKVGGKMVKKMICNKALTKALKKLKKLKSFF